MNNRQQAVRQVQRDLLAMRDDGYQAFHSKLVPNLSPELVIGVRTPQLRAYAKKLAGTETAELFLEQLPHTYYEENNLHGMLLAQIRDFDTCLAQWDRFLPYIDNWATCDLPLPKVFAGHPEEMRVQVRRWINSGETYTVRYGIGVLMRLYLDAPAFQPEYLEWVAQVRSEEYYVNMMIAWYFATALAKQWEAAIGYIEQHRLDVWCHNKAIQKAIESRRLTTEQKDYLRTQKQRK